MVIAVLNPKGGCGKSTLTTNLARALQLTGRAVLIVDTDSQGTLRDWQAMQGDASGMPPVIGLDVKRLHTDLPLLAAEYDTVVIDGTAKMMQGLGLTVKVADAILVPVQPSAADLWAVSGLAELIHTRRKIQDGLPKAAFVISRQIAGSRLAEQIQEALTDYQLPVLDTRISQRVAYTEALAQGVSVIDIEPEGRAADEIRTLMDEVIAWVDEEALALEPTPQPKPARQPEPARVVEPCQASAETAMVRWDPDTAARNQRNYTHFVAFKAYDSSAA